MSWRAVTFGLVSVGFCAFTSTQTARGASIRALGGVPGTNESGTPHVSDDGDAAAGYAGATSATRQAFRWTTGGGMQPVPFPAGAPAQGRALGISGDGNVVVGYTSHNDSTLNSAAFYYTADSAYIINPFGAYRGSAEAAGADGSVIVGEMRDAGFDSRGYRFTEAGGLQLLSHNGAPMTAARGVTPDGSVVVGGYATTGYRWTTSGGYQFLPFVAHDVSDDGQAVIGTDIYVINSFQSERAWLWRQETGAVELGDLPGGMYRANALAVSGDGGTVVGYSHNDSGFEAFVWDASHGMRSVEETLSGLGVEMTGWTLTSADSISADGQYIAGSGWNPEGQRTAWIAHVPEPFNVAALACVAWLSTQRRRGSRPRRHLAPC